MWSSHLWGTFACHAALLCGIAASLRTVKIAGIFDERSPLQTQKVFQYAVQNINEGRSGSALPGTTLVPRTIRDFRADLFLGPKIICDLAEEGTAAVFGSQREVSTAFVASLANVTNLPYLISRWKTSTKDSSMEINLHPDHQATSRALFDLIRYFNWTSFALIYDDAGSLARASTLLDGTNKLKPDIFKLDRSDIESTLRDVQSTGTSFIVIDCPGPVAGEVLKVAKEMDMITFYYHYILSTWDIHLMDVIEYSATFVNITSFQLVDMEDPRLMKLSAGLKGEKGPTFNQRLDISVSLSVPDNSSYARIE
ncbi:hypothetical protein RvY_05553 [Ramazzottius varieornatus]|uniref:Receptor ligand binding region domain-containing protein n=1 Tax=Ramazzottius varieornatus TaxID=947166 RepID=A0A1D1UVD3_RAMVA|nr:hypothetical protein RvY_05553 [Ramazzottius varieornatus]